MARIVITGLPIQKAQVGIENKVPTYDDQWIRKMMEYEQTKGGYNAATNKAFGLQNFGYNSPLGYKYDSVTGKYISKTDGSIYSGNWSKEQPRTIEQAVELYKKEYLPLLSQYPEGIRERAGDFLYNTGEDPRLYMLDQYVRKYANMPLGIPGRGSYRVGQANESGFNDLYNKYAADINKLDINERISLMDKGRDFYYKGINNVNGKPNPAYEATWKGRITNNAPYNPTPVQDTTKLAEQTAKQAESAVKASSISKPVQLQTTTAATPVSKPATVKTRSYVGVTPEEGDAMLKAAKERMGSFKLTNPEQVTNTVQNTPAPTPQKPGIQGTPQNTTGVFALPAQQPIAAFDMFKGIPTVPANQMVAPAVGTKPQNVEVPLSNQQTAINQPATQTTANTVQNNQSTAAANTSTATQSPNTGGFLKGITNAIGGKDAYTNLVNKVKDKLGSDNVKRLENAGQNLGVFGQNMASMMNGLQILDQNERENQLAAFAREHGSSDYIQAQTAIDRGDYSVNPTSYGLFRPNFQAGGDISAISELGNPYETQVHEMETKLPYIDTAPSRPITTTPTNITMPELQRVDGVNPFAISTWEDMSKEFKDITNKGYWGDTAHKKRKSDHNNADAVDLGISSIETGNHIASKLVEQAADRNIKYIIFNRQIWNPADGWKEYKPTKANGGSPHTDHVHVSFNKPEMYVGNSKSTITPEDLSVPMDVDTALAAVQKFESSTAPGQSRVGIPTSLTGPGGKKASAIGTYQMTDVTITDLYKNYYKNQYSSKQAFKDAIATDPYVERDAARKLMQGHINNYGVFALGAWYSPALAKRAAQGDRSVFNFIPSPEYGNKITWGDDFKRKLDHYKKLSGSARRYEDGGEYELTEDEIKEIMKCGGKVEYM